MNSSSRLLRQRSLASASVAILAFALLPAIAAAQRGGGHGGSHGGGSHGGGHHGGGHGGGHRDGHHGGGHGGWGYGGGYHGHSGGYYGSGRGYFPHSDYVSPYSYGVFGYGSYGPYWGAYSNYGAYSPSPYDAYDGPEFGAIDIAFEPGNVKVYEDGRFLGTADEFDGDPSYLWLAEGTHELTFHLDGGRSVVQQVDARPDRIQQVSGSLGAGEASPAEARDGLGRAGGLEIAADQRRTPGRLRLVVEPGDASVYLDGRFLGTGDGLRSGVIVDPGSHVLEVVRPERRGAVWSFEVESGAELEHRVELAAR